jgi:hypothetical protein
MEIFNYSPKHKYQVFTIAAYILPYQLEKLESEGWEIFSVQWHGLDVKIIARKVKYD